MVAYSFKKQFGPPILAVTKAQTIRIDRKRRARQGEMVQLSTGMRTRQCRQLGSRCSGLPQEGDTNLIGVAPNQFGPQLHTLLAYQQIEPAWKDGRASNCEPRPVPGHVTNQAIDHTIAGIEGDLSGQICPPAVQFSTFNRHGCSQDGTDRAVHPSLSNRGAALAPAGALDIAGAA